VLSATFPERTSVGKATILAGIANKRASVEFFAINANTGTKKPCSESAILLEIV
jgi:hypothetical protein